MSGKFQPKEPVKLDPPKDDPITRAELALCDGIKSPKLYVGIKGVVFDVTSKQSSYGPGNSYHAFTGKDASRPLGKSSLDPEDTDPSVSWDYSTLDEKELGVLEDWFTYFKNRYNIVGRIVD